MGRKVKCQICGKQMDQEEAYKYEHRTKTYKKQNKYYCTRKEFHEDYMNKRYYNRTQLLCDKIIGYLCVNNQKNHMITNLYKSGYTPKHVLECMRYYSDEIIKYMELKNIEKEYQKLRYIFSVIENNIKDFTYVPTRKTKSVVLEEPIIEDEDPQVEVVVQKTNRRRSLKDRLGR